MQNENAKNKCLAEVFQPWIGAGNQPPRLIPTSIMNLIRHDKDRFHLMAQPKG
jgi:hypothetical protein